MKSCFIVACFMTIVKKSDPRVEAPRSTMHFSQMVVPQSCWKRSWYTISYIVGDMMSSCTWFNGITLSSASMFHDYRTRRKVTLVLDRGSSIEAANKAYYPDSEKKLTIPIVHFLCCFHGSTSVYHLFFANGGSPKLLETLMVYDILHSWWHDEQLHLVQWYYPLYGDTTEVREGNY